MAEVQKSSVNFVALGRQNPQILNVEWLKVNNIVPSDKEPFRTFFAREKQFDRFVSTPVFSNLLLGPIEFVIDEQRFQVQDKAIDQWPKSLIFQIAQRYFEVLPHTPLRLVGVNLAAKILFASPDEDRKFQGLFLPNNAKLLEITETREGNASVVLRYPFPGAKARAALTINQRAKENYERLINFNYEVDCSDIETLKSTVSVLPDVGAYYDSILRKLKEAL